MNFKVHQQTLTKVAKATIHTPGTIIPASAIIGPTLNPVVVQGTYCRPLPAALTHIVAALKTNSVTAPDSKRMNETNTKFGQTPLPIFHSST